MYIPEYVKLLSRYESRKLLHGLISPAFWNWLQFRAYRKRFPGSYVSGDSDVGSKAKIGTGCLVWQSYVGDLVELGNYSCVGVGSRLGGEKEVRIGRYCSIAPGCFIFSTHHDHRNRTTYSLRIMKEGRARMLPPDCYSIPISVGNDVWIGRDAKILAGAVIPDGCVVGAGAVVGKKQYEPYTILGGVPAKPIGQRFSDETISELLKLEWWNKEGEEIFSEEMVNFLLSKPE
ncbi:hypothetical protein GM415_02230 [Pseudodesulfovibrio cashew]|uniref:Uncharacterized protein n=1 Tax=Pseudodesulfovibrio cashew TaxID=2678688 RepID=A0A6I6JAA8_9BACT|nr:CatB-related O-acetyltransferase [Pseudodesulfovibrio cashew]QGY39001.1 hypothetical protein GM415_02230 [Pseudodesulfovibrio cashew]